MSRITRSGDDDYDSSDVEMNEATIDKSGSHLIAPSPLLHSLLPKLERRPDLTAIREACPRAKETPTDYARRLHDQYPDLTVEDLSLLTGITERRLRFDPVIRPLPEDLDRIRRSCPHPRSPQRGSQHSCDLRYARDLHVKYPDLSIKELSMLSGVWESYLKNDYAIRELPDELKAIRTAIPRQHGEKNVAYARRLHLSHGELTAEQLRLLSGARRADL